MQLEKINDRLEKYHRSRRMFCIKNKKLFIAKQNIPYSHFEWFFKKKLIKGKNDPIINKIIKGFVDKKGDVYFYTNDFKVNKKIEREFIKYIPLLIKKIKLKQNARLYGGFIKTKNIGEQWAPQKKFGKISDF